MSKFGDIRSIEIVIQPGTKKYEVGDEVEIGRFIGYIRNNTNEYPDHIAIMYHIIDTDGDIIATIENCSVNVTYNKPIREVAL